MILGLDLSLTATGWATITPDSTVRTGVIPDTKGHIADRLGAWEGNLYHLLGPIPPTAIYVEDLGGTQHGAFELGMVWGLFWRTMWVTSLNSIVTLVNSSILKMHATGKGGAGKPQVLAEAIRRLDYQGHDHNEADALWLADMGARLHGYDRPALPAAHLKALDKIRPQEQV